MTAPHVKGNTNTDNTTMPVQTTMKKPYTKRANLTNFERFTI